ncbi:hypothetical protein BM525_21325 (plasmid) [Alteromonas mediterranea]|uniref:Glycosyl transferase family 1 domain-containing protein n=1 Tax=Alteromonas mediterranea TaxID=314275 RepID=A0AAC9NUA3_9ALTE|nr:glycosyltransferase [Alteromonas mediterranea]APD92402.1 hypothetical protein BM524_21105 [Alteromonas mediterranea]APE00263.1 hypothetical protein BM525_21325 [Alteromonas mediterranea]
MERILAISTLFPTDKLAHHGVFVFNRLKAMSALSNTEVTVCNPIPTSLLHKLMPRYRHQQSACKRRSVDGMHIYHPRYHTIPGYNKDKEHVSLTKAVLPFLMNLHKQHNFTRIDVHWTYPDLPLALAFAKASGLPCSLTLRGLEAFYLDDHDGRSDLIFEKIGEVDHLISLSQEMLDIANQSSSFKGGHVVTNGADTSRFSYFPISQARRELGLPRANVDVLIGVGSIIKRKGFHHIIEAITILNLEKRKHNPVRYYILGSAGLEGNFEAEVRKQIRRYESLTGREGDIVLAGNIENEKLPLWYNAATAFCLSSFGEGSPNVLTEALSCGCPAIASNVGAVPDIMERSATTGLLINNQKYATVTKAGEQWADKILSILKEPQSPCARQALADKMASYTWEWCAQRSLDVITSRSKDAA